MRFCMLMSNSLDTVASPKDAACKMRQHLDKLRDMCGVVPVQMLLSDIADYCAIVHSYSMEQDVPNTGMHYFLQGRELLNQVLDGLEQDVENNDIFVGTILQDLQEVEEVNEDGAESGYGDEELGDYWERQYPPLFED